MGELYDKLAAYGESDFYPCHMPGHKRRLSGGLPEEIVKVDITEIEGFDNLHDSKDILKKLQEKAARIYGAEESFFLVNGSTGGILSAISAALPVGSRLLMARNSHKSAYHGVYLRKLAVTYLYPQKLDGSSVCDAVTPRQVQEALEKEPDIKAVFIVSPTYEGRISDIRKIAEIVHAKGLILIVDEAHGAHLGLAEGFAENSNQAGADIVIHSVHKTLPALTQSAILHINGALADRERVRRFLHIYQSSSPSYLLMAGIDNALELVEKEGKNLFASFRSAYYDMIIKLEDCEKLRFLTPDPKKQDIGKLVIDTGRAGISGQELYEILWKKYHIQLEMAAKDYCLAMFTIGDTPEGYHRITQALLEIDRKLARQEEASEERDRKVQVQENASEERDEKPSVQENALEERDEKVPVQENALAERDRKPSVQENASEERDRKVPAQAAGRGDVIPLAAAWDMDWEYVPLREAIGRYAAEFVSLYPPGVPILVPGEPVTEEIYQDIRSNLEMGLCVQGLLSGQNSIQIKCIKKF